MPWVLGKHAGSQEYKEYSELTVGDLKERLVRRGLPRSGKKAALVLRLTENDEAHPFPFMKLPPEIRNKIYRLTATAYHFGRLDRYFKEKYRPYRLKESRDQDTMVQPGLVCCSKQTRSEGLLIFLRDHHFLFNLRYWDGRFGGRSVKDLLPWLNKLDPVQRKNIRNITLVCNISPLDVPIMHIIHAKLSDEARVVYKSPEVRDRSVYVTSMLGVVSTFQSWAIAKVGLPTISKKNLAYLRSNPGRLSLDEGSDSLTFLPGLP